MGKNCHSARPLSDVPHFDTPMPTLHLLFGFTTFHLPATGLLYMYMY